MSQILQPAVRVEARVKVPIPTKEPSIIRGETYAPSEWVGGSLLHFVVIDYTLTGVELDDEEWDITVVGDVSIL